MADMNKTANQVGPLCSTAVSERSLAPRKLQPKAKSNLRQERSPTHSQISTESQYLQLSPIERQAETSRTSKPNEPQDKFKAEKSLTVFRLLRKKNEYTIRMTINQAHVHIQHGELTKAQAQTDCALALADEYEDSSLVAKCWFWEGVLQDLANNQEAAADAFFRALSCIEPEPESDIIPFYASKYKGEIRWLILKEKGEEDQDRASVLLELALGAPCTFKGYKYLSPIPDCSSRESLPDGLFPDLFRQVQTDVDGPDSSSIRRQHSQPEVIQNSRPSSANLSPTEVDKLMSHIRNTESSKSKRRKEILGTASLTAVTAMRRPSVETAMSDTPAIEELEDRVQSTREGSSGTAKNAGLRSRLHAIPPKQLLRRLTPIGTSKDKLEASSPTVASPLRESSFPEGERNRR